MPAPIYPLAPPSTPVEAEGLVHILDHNDRAVALLLEQFKDKTRFKKLLEILLRPFQELENVLWDIYTKRRLDQAEGDQLDLLGKIVKEARNGQADAEYRAIISVKIRVLLSRGTADDLIVIARLMAATTPFTYSEVFPATVQIQFDGVPAIAPSLIARMLRLAKAGGVRLDVMYGAAAGADNTLRFGSTASASAYTATIGSSISSSPTEGHIGGLA